MLGHLEAIIHATDVRKVWELHQCRMAHYGFDRLLYGYTRFRSRHFLGDPKDLVVLSNLPSDYLEHYINGGLYRQAPAVQWATANVGALSWRIIKEHHATGALTPEQRQVVEFNHRHGILAGYTISFHDISLRAKGAIGLIARPGMTQDDVEAVWQVHGREITLLNDITHMRIATLPVICPDRALTRRQREVLEWVGEGKTTQDIATIMGLTVTTVEKHLRLAREILDAGTTAQALLKAVLQNQIYVFSPLGARPERNGKKPQECRSPLWAVPGSA
ncbi:LuxR family transcriptional regulator [Plastorhodobacter daqingensis]|uniref:LuxR family transcriptional regulator n=1 Tax=Plastorhodobacter daqingensis TaxID=1387281 RepID=A0ABW2UPJ3_9RHOB